MARTTRKIVANAPNHIVTRGNNRRRLFSYARDYLGFIRLVHAAVRENQCRLHAACLMTNHVHLLITPPSVEAASACVKRFSQRYAQIRNAQRNASGKLFEQRYFSEPIANARQLALATMYIEANPIRAGLVSEPVDYRWCTHAAHAGQLDSRASRTFRGLWTPSGWYQRLGSTDVERAGNYRQLFEDYIRGGEAPDYAAELAPIEQLSATPYQRGLRRPDGTRASEPPVTLSENRSKNRDLVG